MVGGIATTITSNIASTRNCNVTHFFSEPTAKRALYVTQQILERVAQSTEPATLRRDGSSCRLTPASAARWSTQTCCGRDAAAFPIEQLIKSRVFVPGSEGQPILAPVFGYKATSLLFLARPGRATR